MLYGVNLSGAEMGGVIPGVLGSNFVIPTPADAAYYKKQGVGDLFRIPIRWRRFNNKPLAAGSTEVMKMKGWDNPKGEKVKLDTLVNGALDAGSIAIIGIHDYGEPKGIGKIGTGKPDVKWFCDFVFGLVRDYDPDRVWIDLMNEPAYATSWQDWQSFQQQAVIMLRQMGLTNILLVNGGGWQGAHDFVSSGRAEGMASFRDPLDKSIINVHQYLDNDNSGSSGTIKPGSGKRLDAFIAWAEANSRQFIVTEFGIPVTDAEGQKELSAAMTAMASSPAFVGMTAWGGGLWWKNDYHFKLSPTNGAETPQMITYKALVTEARKITPRPWPQQAVASFNCPHCGTSLKVSE